jgi:hypothetical protein
MLVERLPQGVQPTTPVRRAAGVAGSTRAGNVIAGTITTRQMSLSLLRPQSKRESAPQGMYRFSGVPGFAVG